MEEQYKGYSIKLSQDEFGDSPRDWDNTGTLVIFHKRYDFGDKKTSYKSSDYSSWADLEKAIKKNEKPSVILPVYMYDHSGITISTKPFSCPWDSGQVGFIFAKGAKKNLEEILIDEIKVLDQYLTGDVYTVSVDKDGELIDSCGGFYGSDEALKEGRGMVDYAIEKELRVHGEQLSLLAEL